MIPHHLLGSSPTVSVTRPSHCAGLSWRFRSRALAAALFGIASGAGARALEIPYDYYVHCTPENAIFGYFSATKTPVITVPSGAVVRIDGGGGKKRSGQD